MAKRQSVAVRVTTVTADILEQHHPWCTLTVEAAEGCRRCTVLYANYPFLPGETTDEATARYFPQPEAEPELEPEPQLVIIKPGRTIVREEVVAVQKPPKSEPYKIPLYRKLNTEPFDYGTDIQQMIASEKALQASYNSLDKHLRLHRPCREEGLAPNYGSELYKLWQKGHLSKQQLYGWQMFYDDIKRSKGSSNSLVSSMNSGGGSEGSYASRELQKSRPGPSSYWNTQAARLENILGNLHDHERGLLVQLVRDALRSEGYKEIHAHTLAYLGSIMTGYKDNRQAIAGAVARVQALLCSLAEGYGVQPFET